MYLDEKRHGEVAAPVEPWRQVLLDAADYIEQHGWCQLDLQAPSGGVCALGALQMATFGRIAAVDPLPPATDHLNEFLGIQVWCWNDWPDRTKAEVLAALRDCARQP